MALMMKRDCCCCCTTTIGFDGLLILIFAHLSSYVAVVCTESQHLLLLLPLVIVSWQLPNWLAVHKGQREREKDARLMMRDTQLTDRSTDRQSVYGQLLPVAIDRGESGWREAVKLLIFFSRRAHSRLVVVASLHILALNWESHSQMESESHNG